MIRDIRDSFLHFLADNLTGITVHPLRFDKNDPGADGFQTNALNVQFLSTSLRHVATQQVVLDVIQDDENTAVDWLDSMWTLLSSAFYTELYSYSTGSPVDQHRHIMWDAESVRFTRISNDNYVHYSCILPLEFSAINS